MDVKKGVKFLTIFKYLSVRSKCGFYKCCNGRFGSMELLILGIGVSE